MAHGDVSPAVQRDLNVAASHAIATRGADPASTSAQQLPTLAEAKLRRTSSAPPLPPASSQLVPGTRLVKAYQGINHVVEVMDDGFLYAGHTYASLSAIAKVITGTHWNGLLFFGLRQRKIYPKKVANG